MTRTVLSAFVLSSFVLRMFRNFVPSPEWLGYACIIGALVLAVENLASKPPTYAAFRRVLSVLVIVGLMPVYVTLFGGAIDPQGIALANVFLIFQGLSTLLLSALNLAQGITYLRTKSNTPGRP